MRLFGFTVLFVMLASACRPAAQPGIEIHAVRSPATPPGASVAAVYAELKATQADRLLGADTPAAERVEIHSTIQEDGMMHMRPLDTVEIVGSVTFEPGGMHFMLIGLHTPLAAPGTFPMTFHFEKAGILTVEVRVVPPGEGA